ncbi:MAG: peptide chain release factor-like protein [Phycisphaerae bacterium]|nr:peptide chain release factor-like protein [Phycisphaerae bacterium]
MSEGRPIHPAALPDDELLKDVEESRSRASGPGGQHRNKVETRATLVHTPTGVSAQAGERRSLQENRKVALFRLRLALATQVRRAVAPGDARSALWRSRCDAATGRIACNPEHHDFPALLAEALDHVWSCGLDVKKAAARLACSASQLVKLIKDHPHALFELNRARAEHGMHALH